MDSYRCEARTCKATRCKSKAIVYHRHKDGCEYLVCNRHHNEDFRPAVSKSSGHDIPEKSLFRES